MPEELHPLVKLLCEDRRYKLEAYQFVRAGLTYAQEVLKLGRSGSEDDDRLEGPRPLRHVSGQDLCHALRRFAHEQFGLLARHVLGSWGIQRTGDFGEIVFNLIRIGEMTKSRHDRREDFDDVYDFDQALVTDFEITAKSV